MPEDIEIDFSKYKYIGQNENDKFCFRKESDPYKIIPMGREFYIEYQRWQRSQKKSIDAEAWYKTTEAELLGLRAALYEVLDGRREQGKKKFEGILEVIKGRKI